ncbi:MAG: alkaline phosphatase family protein [Lachnospiraceae bacterium]|nr:alkaline phosphatase family protein [Lachnospiraceae bacterium]
MGKRKSDYNVILISVDALAGPDAKNLLDLPAFKYLTENGSFTDSMTTVFPTITYPIHTSAITGVMPDKHNIYHNQFFQPDVPTDLKHWYWVVKDIGRKTLWEAAYEKGNHVASMLWPVSGKCPKIKYDFAEIMTLRGQNPALQIFKYSSVLWLAETELKYGKKVRKSIKMDDLNDYIEFLCERLLEKKRPPELMTIHFAGTDFTRHDYGVGSAEDEISIQKMNDRLQKLIDAVRTNGLEEKTIFIVMSDHGQENVTNGYVPLDEMLVEANGDNENIGNARAQSFGMGAYIFTENYEKTIEYLNKNKKELHIDYVLDRERLRELHADKDVEIAVQAEEGYGFVDRNCEIDHLGDHGFGVEHPTAKALLWLCGKPFEKGKKLENVNITDIAPTIAKIMKLDMPKGDGKTLC